LIVPTATAIEVDRWMRLARRMAIGSRVFDAAVAAAVKAEDMSNAIRVVEIGAGVLAASDMFTGDNRGTDVVVHPVDGVYERPLRIGLPVVRRYDDSAHYPVLCEDGCSALDSRGDPVRVKCPRAWVLAGDYFRSTDALRTDLSYAARMAGVEMDARGMPKKDLAKIVGNRLTPALRWAIEDTLAAWLGDLMERLNAACEVAPSEGNADNA